MGEEWTARVSSTQFVEEYVAVVKQLPMHDVDRAVELLLDAYRRRATVVALGNGGSAATAAHFAADLGKFATWPGVGFRAIDLVSNVAVLSAWTNDEGWEMAYRHQVDAWVGPGDVIVAFSVHGGEGWSNNLVAAIVRAHELGGRSIGVASAGGGRFANLCHVAITVPDPATEFLVTPVAEAAHVMVHHMIATGLRERLWEAG